ncbi:unnamed protein product [Lactuca saligna]|uniref:Uncharacterized protein n=1 Tax=Lactuca saligna TaxID=75948 RepID=A0AA35YYA4_LACSI|nr:unnamed protein product [Lactuca saligna]
MSDITSLPFEATEEDEPVISNSKSFNSGPAQNLTVDDIDDFENDDDLEELNSRRYSRRTMNDTVDLVVVLPSFATGITDDDLRESAYEILLAAAGASGAIKGEEKEKKSKLLKKLGRSKSEQVTNQSQQSTGLTGLLETMCVQMEEVEEILELLKSMWRILGITETIHHTCYAWVLFRQFVKAKLLAGIALGYVYGGWVNLAREQVGL